MSDDAEDLETIRSSIRDVCARFGDDYWQRVDAELDYPTEFVQTLTELGWLSILISEEYGGGGMGIAAAAAVLEEIHSTGGNANACHAQMYIMGTLLRHGTDEQKSKYLPEIAAGRLRLQAFAVTEPDTGSDTTRLTTRAVRDGEGYRINGQKTFISRVEHSDLMLLLARTTPLSEVEKKTDGLSVFLIDMREVRDRIEVSRIPVMFNHHTYQVFISDLWVPDSAVVGNAGEGFRYIISGWNAERILIASEAIGDARYFVEKASGYASERVVFDQPLAANQGVQFPISQAYAQLRAAALMRSEAASLFDAGQPCGPEANMAKLLASQASWQAANAAVTAYGGAAFAVEHQIERKFRETKLLEIAPVSNNLVLAYLGQRVLGMPRSY